MVELLKKVWVSNFVCWQVPWHQSDQILKDVQTHNKVFTTFKVWFWKDVQTHKICEERAVILYAGGRFGTKSNTTPPQEILYGTHLNTLLQVLLLMYTISHHQVQHHHHHHHHTAQEILYGIHINTLLQDAGATFTICTPTTSTKSNNTTRETFCAAQAQANLKLHVLCRRW